MSKKFSDQTLGVGEALHWKELIDFINKMAEFGMISQTDVSLIYATDSVEEAIGTFAAKPSNLSG